MRVDLPEGWMKLKSVWLKEVLERPLTAYWLEIGEDGREKN